MLPGGGFATITDQELAHAEGVLWFNFRQRSQLDTTLDGNAATGSIALVVSQEHQGRGLQQQLL
jgi:hypothetical protein